MILQVTIGGKREGKREKELHVLWNQYSQITRDSLIISCFSCVKHNLQKYCFNSWNDCFHNILTLTMEKAKN